MQFGLLGPLVVRRDAREIPLGGPKQRALLAMLLLDANTVVSRDRMIDGLWGERPPSTADHTLDSYISRLRKVLADDRLSRRAPGYVLRVEPGELDADCFRALAAQGRDELARGDPPAAERSLRAALALWRGPALADVGDALSVRGEAERLEELRLLALEDRIDVDLALGRDGDLVPELEALVADHPFRERALGQLMLALYRASRQVDALAVFRAGRARMVEELGLEPGRELRELEHRILTQDPELGEPRRPTRRGARPIRRRRVAVAAALALVVAGTGIAVTTGGSNATTDAAGENRVVSVGLTTPRSVTLPAVATALIGAYGSLWIASPTTESMSRIDLATGEVADSIPIDTGADLIVAGAGSIWVARAGGEMVRRVDPASGRIVQTVRLRSARAAALAFGAGRLWIADDVARALIAVDPDAGGIERTVPLTVRPSSLAIGNGVIWIADYGGGSVAQVDLRSGRTLATTQVGGGPAAVALGEGAVWVANALDSTVAKLDPRHGAIRNVITVGSSPAAIAVEGGSVWVANEHSGTVSRIDPARAAVAATAEVGGRPAALATADGNVWASVRASESHRGGTFRILAQRPLSIDPAVNADILPLQADALVRDGLVTFAHVPGSAGTQLVPDLALDLPSPSAGGTAYTFRLRRGIRYSDGRPVRASDFRRAFERMFRMRSVFAVGVSGLLGASACTSARCDLSAGVVADDASHNVTLHLREPDPDFLTTLTSPSTAPVPPGTPLRDARYRPIPGTGPYMVADASEREVRYVRNPFFREWSHAAQPDGNPDQILWRFGMTKEAEVRALVSGRADWTADAIPTSTLPMLRTRYSSRLRSFNPPVTSFIQFNTARPPFDDVRARRAVNLALDRREIVRRYGGLASPTCQVLPPGIPGYEPYCPYTHNPGRRWTSPDLERARRLVAASGTRGQRVVLWSWSDDPDITPELSRYFRDVLRELGYRARLKLVTHEYLQDPPERVFARIQLIPAAWGDSPQGFFRTWFACDGTNVHGFYCDHRLDRWMRRAQRLKATQPRAAAALWARIDRALVDDAAWVPTVNDRYVSFTSQRVRNQQGHVYWGLFADQIWLDPQQP